MSREPSDSVPAPDAASGGGTVSHCDSMREAAEAQAAREAPACAPPGDAGSLEHDLRVHQIELEMQNEELRRTQVALAAARDRYLDLYDFSPIGYLTLDAADRVIEANLTSAGLLGVDRAGLVGRRFLPHIQPHDRDRWHRFALARRERGEPGQIELELRRGDARVFPARLDVLPMAGVDPVRGARSLRVAMSDVSESRALAAELERHRHHLQEMVDQRTARLDASNRALSDRERFIRT
ncbi:MAG: PAS domain-containing protein, partial [Burkholderiaceae bacterium]|nr:PAS domain-containing protein [Burkholderiaceae bacterium]